MIHRSTIELGNGGSPICPQSDDADSAPIVVASFFIIALALVLTILSLILSIKEEENMPKLPPKTAETPADKLPFPGKLVEGKYDVQCLHL